MIVRPIRSAPSSRDEIDPRRATTRAYPCQPRSLLLGLDHAPPLRETVPSVQAPDPHRPVRLELTRRPAQCTVTARAALVRDPIHPSARRTGHDEPSVRSLPRRRAPLPRMALGRSESLALPRSRARRAPPVPLSLSAGENLRRVVYWCGRVVLGSALGDSALACRFHPAK